MNLKLSLVIFFSISLTTLMGCGSDEENSLKVSVTNIVFEATGGTSSFKITTDAGSWSIENSGADWIGLSATSGKTKEATISVFVNTVSDSPRTDSLTVTAGNAEPVVIVISQKAAGILYTLTPSITEINFDGDGTPVEFTLTTTAPEWNITTEDSWLTVVPNTGSGDATIKVSATENNGTLRNSVIKISADYASTVDIAVSQEIQIYPNYNTSPIDPDATGMSSNAQELAAKIKLGWNMGNSLEAIGGETAWGNPAATQELINLVKANGFNAVRLPCSWNQYLSNDATAEISVDWLERVKEVITYCVNNDMYVLLNIHWDGGWLENNCTADKQEMVNAKQKAFWEQIATYMRDFDEHLMFASANEPNVDNAAQMNVLSKYHQTFINAVRSTGGKNAYRVLVVQGPSTDVEKTNNLMKLPTDVVENRIMVEVHYYTPYQFTLMDEDATWGKMFYFWGANYHSATLIDRNSTWGEEATVDQMMGLMKTKYTSKRIPVILGEYAAGRRSTLTGEDLALHLQSRAWFLEYVTRKALANGILPFYWDAGGLDNMGSGIFDRKNKTVFDQMALDALKRGATE